MKKLKLIAVSILIVFAGCSEQKNIIKNEKMTAQLSVSNFSGRSNDLNKKVEENFTTQKNIKLPDYKEIKNRDFYDKPLIVYSENNRGAFLVAKEILSYLQFVI